MRRQLLPGRGLSPLVYYYMAHSDLFQGADGKGRALSQNLLSAPSLPDPPCEYYNHRAALFQNRSVT